MKKLSALLTVLFMSTLTFATSAFSETGQPTPKQLNFQPPVTEIHEQVWEFHNLLLPIITAITIFVLGLLLYVMVRFRKSANPVPSKTSHNTFIEIIWTLVPVIILIVISLSSFRLLYLQNQVEDAEMTINVSGYQWYWGYEYPDHGNFSFLSYMVPDEDLKPGQPRLLQTDTEMVVPVDTKVRLIITGKDVIHSWTIPAFGVKKDAVPGHFNEIWFEVKKEGVYYGQCSEICGTGHGFMPITVRVVSKEKFEDWVKWAQEEYASIDGLNTRKFAELR